MAGHVAVALPPELDADHVGKLRGLRHSGGDGDERGVFSRGESEATPTSRGQRVHVTKGQHVGWASGVFIT